MMARTADRSQAVRIANLNAVLRSLARMPKEATDGLRDEAQAIATDIVNRARGSASAPQMRLAAQSLKAKRDRIPVIEAGGTKRLPVTSGRKRRGPDRSRQTYGDVFFGAEFGGSRGSIAASMGAGVGETVAYRQGGRTRYSTNRGSTRQFPPHRGREGYFLFPTVRSMRQEITNRYFDALDRALVKAGAR
jgi:hypothetical protein